MAQTKLRPVSRANPCLICEGTHKCSRGDDRLIMCGRPPENTPSGFIDLGPAKGDEQFRMFRRADDPIVVERDREWRRQNASGHKPNGQPETNGTTGHTERKPSIDFGVKAAKCAAAMRPQDRVELAEVLGLPASAIDSLDIGFSESGFHNGFMDKACWTFPERDAAGRTLGICVRYSTGEKKAMPSSVRGLCIPAGWRERDGPIFLPEGASDTLTLSALGLAAVGRPSKTGGVHHLAELLRQLPPEREIVVLGEFDPKADGEWPGRDGAVKTATDLADCLGRDVWWALPPNSAKDVRDWTQTKALGRAALEQWSEAGNAFRDHVRAARKKVAPPPTSTDSFLWKPIDSEVFANRDCRPTWLLQQLLVKDQPCIVGGPKKTLKTSILLDLGLSLASGGFFLGKFRAYRSVRTAILSGESGEFTLQETARRICKTKGIELSDLGDMLQWQFTLPQLANKSHVEALRSGLSSDGVEVVIIDPLYLALLAGVQPGTVKAESIFDMGPLLQSVTRACLDAGATPILIHHSVKRAGGNKDPLELDDLSFSGCAEFARQWFLISRRSPFVPGSGKHALWLSAGGSIISGGLWGIDVNEGVIDEDFDGRTWELAIVNASEIWEEKKAEKDDEKAAKKAKDDAEDDEKVLGALDMIDKAGNGVSYANVENGVSISRQRFAKSVSRLAIANVIKDLPPNEFKCEIGNGAFRSARGLRRVKDTAVMRQTNIMPPNIAPVENDRQHDVPGQGEHHADGGPL